MPLKDKEKQRAYLKDWRARNKAHVQSKLREKYATQEGYASNRSSKLKKMYGITFAEYERMFTQQNGLCFLCGKAEVKYSQNRKTLAVDHDHATGKIRKLLCINCNRGIGAFGDNVVLMERAIQYIKEHQYETSKS